MKKFELFLLKRFFRSITQQIVRRIDDYSRHDNEQIDRQNNSEGDSCFLVRTRNEHKCRGTLSHASWVCTVYESFLRHGELQFQQTWIKRLSVLWEPWLGYLHDEPVDRCSIVSFHNVRQVLHTFASDLCRSFSKFASINDWSCVGEGLANDTSRTGSFCSSQINFSPLLRLLLSLDTTWQGWQTLPKNYSAWRHKIVKANKLSS